jgi:hypothetical protein
VWKEVCQRYTNSRLLAHAHLVELFDMQAQTKSSPVNMRSILDRTKEEVRALEALGCLVLMTLRRLDSSTRLEWQQDLTNSDKQKKLVDSAYTPAFDLSATRAAKRYRCETFKGRSAEERRDQVYRLQLCLNCLGKHRVRNCRSTFACRTCAQKHHTLLHDCYKRPDPPKRAPESASVNMVRPLHLNRVVLLATAQVIVCSPTGKQTQTRALLDSGSEITLIAEHVVHQLQLPRMSSSLNICGIGETAAA